MTFPLSNRNAMPAANDLSADSRSLDALKREARNDPKAAAKKVATQFEALFMQMVLKSMRDATPKSGLLGTDSGHETYTAMLDQQLATKMAASGTGLADTIARQLTRHLASAPAAPVAASAREARADAVATRITDRGSPISDHRSQITDKYAELAQRNPNAMSRYDALAPTAESRRARAEYLSRSAPMADAPAAASPPAAAPDERLSSPQRDFVLRHWDQALAAERATGVPARFIVSQAALESGWGKHEIRGADGAASHNLFGVKAGGGWKGRTVDVVTTEYENGTAKKVVEKFRAYTNTTEAFRDWAQLMANNPRYAQVLQQGKSGTGFAFGLQQAGYATDPRYAEKLAKVIDVVSAVRT